MNSQGDIAVGHEKRLSVIKFQTYWPFRGDKGELISVGTEPRRLPIKLSEVKDQLFYNMKKRDDIIRE